MKHYIIYDLETKKLAKDVPGGWSNVYGMGMSSGVTYCSKTDMYMFWDENQRDDLCNYLNGKLAVGFNSIRFDSKLLLGDNRIIESNGVTKNDKYSWFNSDIYVEIWRNILAMDRNHYPDLLISISKQKFEKNIFDLHSITQNTIGHTKSGDGAMAPELYQKGEIFKLLQYNLQDVRCTRELFEFIIKYRYVVTGKGDIVQFR